MLVYFLIAFSILGFHDFLCWKLKYESHKLKLNISSEEWTREDQNEYDKNREFYQGVEGVVSNVPRVVWIRIGFEFILPALIAVISVASLCRLAIYL